MIAKDSKKTEIIRDDGFLLDMVYKNLIAISCEIQNGEKTNAELIDSFVSLLTIYFDVQDDGF